MSKKKILFVGGSLNQTQMVHATAVHLQADYDCYFTPFYGDPPYDWLARLGLLNFTIFGGRFRVMTETYLAEHKLPVDFRGQANDPYDLYVITTDLIMPRNIRGRKTILIQEGMTDPEDWMYRLVRRLGLPRYLASTAANGLSQEYDYFCVASPGYRDFFAAKGIDRRKLIVTGIPNFDNCTQFYANDFPYRNYVLVATSDARETFRRDDRAGFIRKVLAIAHGRPLIFKLHPNENHTRASREIRDLAPHALILTEGDIGPMIANCDVLVTQYSTVSYVGLALGKEVHSYFDVEMLRRLTPVQNGGASGSNIAAVCRAVLESQPAPSEADLDLGQARPYSAVSANGRSQAEKPRPNQRIPAQGVAGVVRLRQEGGQ